MKPNQAHDTHPSFALVRFARINGGGRRFFQSHIKCDHWIQLTVSRAERAHDLGRDWLHGRETLLELRMTPNQFAELLTTMNVGSGVPATLEFLQGEVDELPEEEGEVRRVQKDFRADMQDRLKSYEAKIKEVEAMLEKPNLPKKDRKEIQDLLHSIISQFKNSMPFYLEQFDEAAQKIVQEIKAEADAFVTHTVQAAGLEALRKNVPKLEKL